MFDYLIYDELKIVKGLVNKPFECVKEIIINEYITLDYTFFSFTSVKNILSQSVNSRTGSGRSCMIQYDN